MMQNKVDYDQEISKILEENIKILRNEIKSRNTQLKIENFANKYGYDPKYIEQKIIDDNIFAVQFAKDPGRQSSHEKIAASFIENLDIVKNRGYFINLPAGGINAKYITRDGVKTGLSLRDTKSIDFEIGIDDQVVYASCKYTKDFGGSQDNQFNDLKNYITTAVEMIQRGCKEDNEHVIVICDGGYYTTDKRNELITTGLGQVDILSINDVDSYLRNLVSEDDSDEW